MPSLMNRVSTFARSPQGRKLAERAQGIAKSPATRRRVEDVRRRFAKRR
jgi:hypothetical protein